MLVKAFAAALQGIHARVVTIEANCSKGIQFYLVGLPDNAVKESHERIVSALEENGYTFPRKRLIINMAPADLKKEGAAYDLPLAIAIQAAAERIPSDKLESYIMMGELSLDGTLKPVKGILPIAIKARDEGFKGVIVPKQNAQEAAVVDNLEVYAANNIREVIEFFKGENTLQRETIDLSTLFEAQDHAIEADFSEVKGQENVKRALEVAAAGGHNIIMIGPPGAGKSMMAKRIGGILPPLTLEEALETTKIHSVAGKVGEGISLISQRPFRSPHHSISDVAMVGGGTFPQPGEISLAHNGVLFLDELPEFRRNVLEVMRQPLEDHTISISRAKYTLDYPAGFMLVASMNPCPCGYYNHPDKHCSCTSGMVQKYLSRISGPMLDRIDIHVEITPVPFEKISDNTPAESSEAIRQRVVKARAIQKERFQNEEGIHCNAHITPRLFRKYCQPSPEGLRLLKTAMERLSLSARAYDRILKVARTIADLENCDAIATHHIAEAINYRSLDRENWGV